MQKRKLGNTNIKVTKICLGTMTWGYQNSEDEAHEQLDYATENGINFIDTAEVYAVPPSADTYTKTEKMIGNWLEKRKKRDDLVIASKVVGKGRDYARGGEGFTKNGILEAIEGSLKRLKTDYLDLYQLHWPQRDVPLWGKANYSESMISDKEEQLANILETLEALDEIEKSGKVKHFGLSNETPWGAMKFLELAKDHNLPRMVSIQNAYSLVRREYEAGLSEISINENIGLLAYSPLAGGVLSGKYLEGKKPKGARYSTWGDLRMGYYMKERVESAVEDYKKIADDAGITLAQMSLAFVNEREFVTSNIIGATSLEQLKENISSADIKLSDDVIEEINKIYQKNPNPSLW